MRGKSGFSLIELMAVVAVFSILTFGILSMLQSGMKSSATVERGAAVAENYDFVRRLMGKTEICTPNIRGKTLPPPDAPFLALPGLNYYSSGVMGDPFLELNVASQGVVPVSVGIRMRQALTAHSAVADLKIAYRGAKDAWGNFEIERTIPIFVSTVAGTNEVVECSDLGEDGAPLYEKICDVSSKGRDYYDPNLGECKSRFEQKCAGQSHAMTATCDSGWQPIGDEFLNSVMPSQCRAVPPGGFSDPIDAALIVTGKYTGGKIVTVYPPAHICETTGTSTTCLYREGIAPAGWTCEICCERQVVF